ncbi:MAG: hypothetical protein ABW195_05760 [Ilumatobacteraceae bacterium]
MTDQGDRYAGQPFLRLVELLVLWAVGEITDADQARLEAMTPKFREVFTGDGPWPEIIAAQAGLSEQDLDQLRAMWQRNQERARAAGVALDAEDWARQVADRNVRD